MGLDHSCHRQELSAAMNSIIPGYIPIAMHGMHSGYRAGRGSRVNAVDSSCWLEYFAGTPAARRYAAAIEDTSKLVVPVITLYEVFKKIYAAVGEAQALLAIAHMRQGKVVDVDARLALDAARLGATHRLPMADSLIYAAARCHGATLWTQDEHFAGLHGVRYFPA